MNYIAHDLFLLMSNLSQMKNRELLVNLFTGAINSFHPDFFVSYQDTDPPPTGQAIEIQTAKNHFGYLEIQGDPELVAPEFPILLQNAVQMLAVILENRVQERMLADENLALSAQVNEKTRSLQQSYDLLTATQKLARVGGWEWDSPAQAFYWTDETYRIHGLSPEEIVPGSREHIDHSIECYNPEDRSGVLAAFQNCIELGQPYDLEYPFTDFKGRRLWVRTTAHPIYEDGQVVRVIGNIIDITDRKRAEMLLQTRLRLSELAQRASLEELLQSALDEAEALTGSSIAFFHFIEEEQTDVTLYAWSTNTIQHLCQAEGKGWHYPVDEAGVWADPLRTGGPVVYNDYPGLAHRNRLPPGHPGLQRMISLPVARAGRVVAIIGLGNKTSDYTQEDIDTLQTLASVVFDLIDHKRAEDWRRESERKLRIVFEILPVGISILNLDSKIVYMNPALERILGTTRQELLQGNYSRRSYLRPDGSIMPANEFPSTRAQREQRIINNVEIGVVTEDGKVIWTSVDAVPVTFPDWKVVVVTSNITERRQAEQQVRTTLAEKEILLRELYHRTKNNMQVIYAMLSLQAAHIADERLQTAFTATQNRILAMSLVHQKLYQEQNLSRINLSTYIHELAQLLVESYAAVPHQIALTITTEEKIHILIDTALPCGLILNELITNALVHAFPNGRRGVVHVQLQQVANHEIVLQVSDDGVGLPAGFDVRKATSLGFSTILVLAKQLQGEVIFTTEQGLTCQLRFRNDLHVARV